MFAFSMSYVSGKTKQQLIQEANALLKKKMAGYI